MKRWVARASCACLGALLSVGIPQAEAAETVGAMKEVVRTVYGTPPQGAQGATRIGDEVVHNEAFETWKESRALLEFIDGSHLSLGANSKVLIDDFVFDSAQVKGNALIKLSVGTLRFVTGRMPHGGVVIKTPTATLTLRGTDVTVYVHPDGTTDTTVQSGLVEAHNDINGDTDMLAPGDGATVGANGNHAFAGDSGPGSIGGSIGAAGGNLAGANQHENARGGGPARTMTAPAAAPAEGGDADGDSGDCGCI
ncbi:MAG: FecR family protein [Dongia sp.]